MNVNVSVFVYDSPGSPITHNYDARYNVTTIAEAIRALTAQCELHNRSIARFLVDYVSPMGYRACFWHETDGTITQATEFSIGHTVNDSRMMPEYYCIVCGRQFVDPATLHVFGGEFRHIACYDAETSAPADEVTSETGRGSVCAECGCSFPDGFAYVNRSGVFRCTPCDSETAMETFVAELSELDTLLGWNVADTLPGDADDAPVIEPATPETGTPIATLLETVSPITGDNHAYLFRFERTNEFGYLAVWADTYSDMYRYCSFQLLPECFGYDPEYVTRVYWARVTANEVQAPATYQNYSGRHYNYVNHADIYRETCDYIRTIENRMGVTRETPVTLNSEFARILERMKGECPISRALLAMETTNKHGDKLALRDGRITFLPTGREHVTFDDGIWSPRNRMNGKPARIVRKFLNAAVLATLTDKDFELFANLIAGVSISSTGNFNRVTGEDVRFWYHVANYAPQKETGTLGSSCMRYSYAQEYLDMYVYNPDKVSLLTLTATRTVNEDGEPTEPRQVLLGRALVWETDNHGTVMDRVYGTDGTIAAFREYAESQRWGFRAGSGYTPDPKFAGAGDDYGMCVTLDNADFSAYPYMDTFTNLHRPSGRLSAQGDYDVMLTGTGGTDHDGMRRTYRVEVRRPVTVWETAYIDIEAESESAAISTVDEMYQRTITREVHSNETDYDNEGDAGDWETVDATETD